MWSSKVAVGVPATCRRSRDGARALFSAPSRPGCCLLVLGPPGGISLPCLVGCQSILWSTVRHIDLVEPVLWGNLSPGYRLCLCPPPRTLASRLPHSRWPIMGATNQLHYVTKHQLFLAPQAAWPWVPGFLGHGQGTLTVGVSSEWGAPSDPLATFSSSC